MKEPRPSLGVLLLRIDALAKAISEHEKQDKTIYDKLDGKLESNVLHFKSEHVETRTMLAREMEQINRQFEAVAQQIAGVNNALAAAQSERRISLEAAAELKEHAEDLKNASRDMQQTAKGNTDRFEAIRASLAAMHDVMQRFK